MVRLKKSAENPESLHEPDLFVVDFEEIIDRIRESSQHKSWRVLFHLQFIFWNI